MKHTCHVRGCETPVASRSKGHSLPSGKCSGLCVEHLGQRWMFLGRALQKHPLPGEVLQAARDGIGHALDLVMSENLDPIGRWAAATFISDMCEVIKRDALEHLFTEWDDAELPEGEAV